MARFFILFALCLLPALVSARPVKVPFIVHGRVYCDTCKIGFETPVTTYIEGAVIKVVCSDRDSQDMVYSRQAVTDKTGSYEVTVADDHADQVCESVLVSSPQANCATPMPGREKAVVILTNNNGIVSNNRFANNLGFVQDHEMAGCTQIAKMYEPEEQGL